jgi:hypothetical protein
MNENVQANEMRQTRNTPAFHRVDGILFIVCRTTRAKKDITADTLPRLFQFHTTQKTK